MDCYSFLIWCVNVDDIRRVRRVRPRCVRWRCRQVIAWNLLRTGRVITAVTPRLRLTWR